LTFQNRLTPAQGGRVVRAFRHWILSVAAFLALTSSASAAPVIDDLNTGQFLSTAISNPNSGTVSGAGILGGSRFASVALVSGGSGSAASWLVVGGSGTGVFSLTANQSTLSTGTFSLNYGGAGVGPAVAAASSVGLFFGNIGLGGSGANVGLLSVTAILTDINGKTSSSAATSLTSGTNILSNFLLSGFTPQAGFLPGSVVSLSFQFSAKTGINSQGGFDPLNFALGNPFNPGVPALQLDPSPVPEPATLATFGLMGLLGGCVLRRKMKAAVVAQV